MMEPKPNDGGILQGETPVTIGEASRLLPNAPCVATVRNWCKVGCKGVQLESVVLGGRRYTSHEAISRFLERSPKDKPKPEKKPKRAKLSPSGQDELLVTLAETTHLFPNAPCLATIRGWCKHGRKGVWLESVVVDGRRYTSTEAITRFLETSSENQPKRGKLSPSGPDESLVTMVEASRLFPEAPCCRTVLSWCNVARKGVRLESIVIGRHRYTSKEAISRFLRARRENTPKHGKLSPSGQDELLVSLVEASRLFPDHNCPETIRRWCVRGAGGIRLESIVIARRRYTSHEAIARFLDARRREPTKRPRTPSGPTEKTRKQIVAAVRMRVFQGKTAAKIAEALDVSAPMIAEWHTRYAPIWKAAEDAATVELVDLVRSQAGTDAIFDDPDLYLSRAKVADKWIQARGESLFPKNDAPTLCSFYRSYYLQVCLSEAADKTKEGYEGALRLWRLVTGDPPLAEITAELLAKFRDVLSKRSGKRTHVRASAQTVKSKLKHIQAVLDKAGPPERRNRDAAGIIDKAPWIRPPRVDPPSVRIVEPDVLNTVYAAAVGMEEPWIGNIKPPKWWRALIVTTFNTGLRRRTLFRLRWEWVDWREKLIRIPGDAMKSHRIHVAHLNETTVRHLRAIHTDDRELIFQWPYNMTNFYKHLHKLLDLTGIPREEHFGLHVLRKTLGTASWTSNPQAAQLALGHADSVVTQNHYVEEGRIVAAAIDALPQPTAFTQAIKRPE